MYKKRINGNTYIIIRDSDSANIPPAQGNRHYKQFLQWMDENNLTRDDIEVIEPPPVPPEPAQKEVCFDTALGKLCYKDNGVWKEVV